MTKDVNWIRLGIEIKQTLGGFTVLRMLQAHGITEFIVNDDKGNLKQSCSIDMVIDYAHKET